VSGVNQASWFDELYGVQGLAATIALITAGIFIATMRADSFHISVCQESREGDVRTGLDIALLDRALGASFTINLLLVLAFEVTVSTQIQENFLRNPGRNCKAVIHDIKAR
jgi:hypothetical protein